MLYKSSALNRKRLPVQVTDMSPKSPTLESSTSKQIIIAPIIILMLLMGAGFGWMAGAGLYSTIYRPIPVPNDPPASMSDQPETTPQPLAEPEPRREVREARGAEASVDRVPLGLTKFGAVGRILSRIVRIGRGDHRDHGKNHRAYRRHNDH